MASEPILGTIFIFAGNFAPTGYAMCNGELLSIAQNTALFSIIGTTYGGDGQTTFALPNLQSRVPVGFGTGNGLSQYNEGQTGGVETVALTVGQMPQHNHELNYSNTQTTNLPAGAIPAADGAYSTQSADGQMSSGGVTNTGGSQPHQNLQPYLALNFIIALQGIFPSRN
jgi:microcystin-dependent protein